jgi:hypothetical protein
VNFSEFLQPAIFGLTGKPGAGKSYFATRLIIAEIKEGKNRPIVTNVPINKKKLREYVGKDFYYYPLETYTDNKAFFSNRGYYKLENIPDSENVDFEPLLKENDEGVLFIIDEAHLYFNARNWKHMPQATISYITTIRHVGDSLVWMCQKFSDIDSQIRGKTQAFHLLRNLQKEKLGIFKRGSGFKCYQYVQERDIQNHGSQTSQPSWQASYPFDLKIAECYSTSLFNKNHDSKYKIKGIPLNYVMYLAIGVFVLFLAWVYNGGFTSIMSSAIPDIGKIQNIETSTVTNAKIDSNYSLPSSDPFTTQPVQAQWREAPSFFNSRSNQNFEPFQFLEDDEYERKKDFWFGKSIKCKITFISDKVTKQNIQDFSFSAVWNKFAALNKVSVLTEGGIWQMQTPYFNSFINFVRDNGQGANMKETDLILKENVPFDLTHGYELPYNSSLASQGVIRSSRQYKEVGFSLLLKLEVIDGTQLLKVDVENSDAMDITSDEPILQTFKSGNVIDVIDGMTYQIADFRSQTSQVSKGIFSKSDYSTQVTNKIFLTYGNN